jgi:dihydroxyacetone kinase
MILCIWLLGENLVSPFRFCSLGGTPLMELMIAAGKAVPKLQLEFGLAVDRVYTGFFMTSLDMAGEFLSISSFS